MGKSYFILIFFLFNHIFVFSQIEEEEEYQNFWQYGKEVGINTTPLITKFIPFNFSDKTNIDQLYVLKTKWYGQKRAFIVNFGVDILDSEKDNSIFLSLGYERRRNISHKWKYTTGWEATFIASTEVFDEVPRLGFSKPYGIEYHFHDNFYLSTEARLFIGFNDGVNIRLFYPTSIFFNMLLE